MCCFRIVRRLPLLTFQCIQVRFPLIIWLRQNPCLFYQSVYRTIFIWPLVRWNRIFTILTICQIWVLVIYFHTIWNLYALFGCLKWIININIFIRFISLFLYQFWSNCVLLSRGILLKSNWRCRYGIGQVPLFYVLNSFAIIKASTINMVFFFWIILSLRLCLLIQKISRVVSIVDVLFHLNHVAHFSSIYSCCQFLGFD